jgi:hypothetical protein
MPGSSKGNWSKAAIGGLVLLNLVLFILLALRNPSGTVTAQPVEPKSDATVSARPTPTASEPVDQGRSPSPEPTADASASGSPTPTASAPADGRSTRMLAVSSDTLAWRAVFAGCSTDSATEVSRDGGQSWRPVTSGLRSVSRLRAYSETSVFAVGGTEDCETRYVATGGPGEEWVTNGELLDQTWYRVPRRPDRVHAPDGRVSQPCDDELRDFAGLGDLGAAALCSDGRVRLTQDRGERWRDIGGRAAALALGADEQTYAVAMRRSNCDGVAVTLLEPGAEEVDRDAVRCAPVGRDGLDEVAVGVRGDVLWLWLGDQVSVSTDRGRTWEQST